MDSSDSLKLDENLARFLAAYDQEIDGGDAKAGHGARADAGGPAMPVPAKRAQVTPMTRGRAERGLTGRSPP